MNISSKPTIQEIQDLYRTGISVRQVCEVFLERITELDPQIQAFARIYSKLALQTAEHLDEMRESQDIDELLKFYPLFGIPYVLKDNILVEGLPVTAQSQVLDGYVAVYSSDVYTYLENAGGILLGHGNMDELAMGSSTEFSGYGQITHNPVDTSRVAGGSSGGPAAAVAGSMAVFAIGSDTGGSVRQPASFTGIYGYRPTWGLLSRYGIVATASSLDQPGIFANSLTDVEKILSVLCIPSPMDGTNRMQEYKKSIASEKYTIGIPNEFFTGLQSDIAILFEKYIEKLRQKYKVIDVHLPSSQYNLAAYYLLMTVEAASNFERFDGVRYGPQTEGEAYYVMRGSHFGDEAIRRIMLGTYASSAGYIDQFYNQAKRVRATITEEFASAFQQVDVLLTPVSPFPAFKIGEKSKADPIEMYLADIMTLSPALAGNASISVPIGTIEVDSKALPVGAQFITDQNQDAELFAFLHTISSLYEPSN